MQTTFLRRASLLGLLAIAAAACGGGTSTDPTTSASEPSESTPATGEPSASESASPSESESDTGPPTAHVDGILTIGSLLPETGDLAVLGPPMYNGVELAISQINEAGGALGQEVAYVQGDDGTDEEIAGQTADRLINTDNVDAIVGPASSRITLSVIDTITGDEIVECSPSNTGSGLTTHEADVPGFYFRTPPADNLQGPALADVILADGHQTVTIVHLNDEYGSGFAGHLETALTGGGATVVKVPYDPDGEEFSTEVGQALEAGSDAIALLSFPDTGTKIISGLLEGGIEPSQMYTADGMQSGDVIALVSGGAETFADLPEDQRGTLDGMKGTAPSSQGSEAFQNAFTAFAPEGTAQIFSAHAYDCVIIIALAASVAGTDAGPDIAAEMVGVTRDGEKCTDYAACLALIEAGTDIDYDGAAGPGEWVDEGEPSAGTYEVWQFDGTADGGYTTTDTVDVG